MPLVLTIDVGSSSLRTNVFDEMARPLPGCEVQSFYSMRTTPDGGVETSPDALLSTLLTSIDQTLAKAGKLATSIAGVGFCSLVSNVLGVDASGTPTTPLYIWADTRAALQAEQLRAHVDDAALHERTGCHIHTSYLPSRLLWVQEQLPQVYGRTARWISLGEYVYSHLLEHYSYSQSLSVASWSGLLNRHTLDWDNPLLSLLGLDRDRLPALVDAYDGLQGLKPDFAARWHALKDACWFPCVGDGASSNLGSGCYTSSEWAVQVGTSGAMRTLLPGGPSSMPSGLWCYRLDRRTALLGGALSEGGNVFAWLRNSLNVPDFEALERAAANMPADAHGLTILPFITGERSPGWNPSARMMIAGISLSTTPGDIIRAAQEAIVYRFAAIYTLLTQALPAPNRIVASGGALLHTPGWIQMLSDALGIPVTASGESEASSRGAALIALHGTGILPEYESLPAALGPTYNPNLSQYNIYQAAMQRQAALYKAT